MPLDLNAAAPADTAEVAAAGAAAGGITGTGGAPGGLGGTGGVAGLQRRNLRQLQQLALAQEEAVAGGLQDGRVDAFSKAALLQLPNLTCDRVTSCAVVHRSSASNIQPHMVASWHGAVPRWQTMVQGLGLHLRHL